MGMCYLQASFSVVSTLQKCTKFAVWGEFISTRRDNKLRQQVVEEIAFSGVIGDFSPWRDGWGGGGEHRCRAVQNKLNYFCCVKYKE